MSETTEQIQWIMIQEQALADIEKLVAQMKHASDTGDTRTLRALLIWYRDFFPESPLPDMFDVHI